MPNSLINPVSRWTQYDSSITMFPPTVLLDTLRSKKIGYLGLDVYRPARVEVFCHENLEPCLPTGVDADYPRRTTDQAFLRQTTL